MADEMVTVITSRGTTPSMSSFTRVRPHRPE
jgi:hypothetical protein